MLHVSARVSLRSLSVAAAGIGVARMPHVCAQVSLRGLSIAAAGTEVRRMLHVCARASLRSLSVAAAGILGLVCSLISAGGCASDDQRPPQSLQAHVVLPEYPFAENDAILVDPVLLDRLATDFLVSGGRVEDVERFLFSYVPVWAFSLITIGDLTCLESLGGLFYLSGFFGGLWLKGVLEPGGNEAVLAADASHPGENSAGVRAPDPVGSAGDFARYTSKGNPAAALFSFLAGFAGILTDKARSADAASLNRFLADNLGIFITLYGYNRGYLESILENPPGGVVPPAGYLVCGTLLDCRTPVAGIPALERLRPVLDFLDEPPDERWELIKATVDRVGPPAVEMGALVWTTFLHVDQMLPAQYEVLLDLSAGFLLQCQLLVLASMDAWVAQDEAAARIAVSLSAGMTAWVGGYAIGLVSSSPGDVLPCIEVIPAVQP